MTQPTLTQCRQAGIGPGLPDTPEERERFEAYMAGHHWAVGVYDTEQSCYDTVFVRCVYGVWRDRGLLAQTALAEHTQLNSDSICARILALNQRDAAQAEAEQLRAENERLKRDLAFHEALDRGEAGTEAMAVEQLRARIAELETAFDRCIDALANARIGMSGGLFPDDIAEPKV